MVSACGRRMAMANALPATAAAMPMTMHTPMMRHEVDGTGTALMTSPMPKWSEMRNAMKHAMSMEVTYCSCVNRMSSSTSMHDPSGAKNRAEKAAAMPIEAM